MKDVFTIGYGNRSVDDFVCLLRTYNVQIICDIRSTPYSRRFAEFNREPLRDRLGSYGVIYLFLGASLGARPSDPDLYASGRASYKAIAQSTIYHNGIEKLRKGMNSHRIAIMCAEKDPLDCHRSILVGRTLASGDANVQHIGSDGRLESQPALERRMLEKYGLEQASLFETIPNSAALAEAYDRRGRELAYDIEAAYRSRASS